VPPSHNVGQSQSTRQTSDHDNNYDAEAEMVRLPWS
jgi:hypothetical protein